MTDTATTSSGCANSPGSGTSANLPSYLQQVPEATDELGVPVLLFIENNGFFPNIDPVQFTQRYFVDKSYAEQRRLEVLKLSIFTVNDELASQVCRWNRLGYYSLEDVPQDEIELVYGVTDAAGTVTEQRETIKEYIAAYRQAVFCKAMELLNERYRSTDTKRYGERKADSAENSADTWEVEYRLNIYKLTGRRGRSVFAELI